MKLGVKDRIALFGVLPQQGDFVTMTVKHDLSDKLKITQTEIEEFGIKSGEGNLTWDASKEKEIDFEFTELELKLVKDSLEEMNNKKSLNDDTFNLYKKFNA
jgi:hypothetical protein